MVTTTTCTKSKLFVIGVFLCVNLAFYSDIMLWRNMNLKKYFLFQEDPPNGSSDVSITDILNESMSIGSINTTEERPNSSLVKHSSIENQNSSIVINLPLESQFKQDQTYQSDTNLTENIGSDQEIILSASRRFLIRLQDIHKSTNNIFFVETKCATEKMAEENNQSKGLLVNARQSCAIESTALTNVDRRVYLMHTCPLTDDFLDYSPEFMKRVLLTYPNIFVVRMNMSEVLFGSPLQHLYERRLLETSSYPMEHASDVLRFTLLWRFGGIYSDSDVVTIRSFSDLKTNWAGFQDEATINCGVLNFAPRGEGHAMAEEALALLNDRFAGDVWAANGPAIITEVAMRHCNVSTIEETVKRCKSKFFTVHDSKILYLFNYPSYGVFFDEKIGEETVRNLKSASYSVHMWNKMSKNSVVKVGSTQAYALLADEFCPQVYRNCGDEF